MTDLNAAMAEQAAVARTTAEQIAKDLELNTPSIIEQATRAPGSGREIAERTAAAMSEVVNRVCVAWDDMTKIYQDRARAARVAEQQRAALHPPANCGPLTLPLTPGDVCPTCGITIPLPSTAHEHGQPIRLELTRTEMRADPTALPWECPHHGQRVDRCCSAVRLREGVKARCGWTLGTARRTCGEEIIYATRNGLTAWRHTGPGRGHNAIPEEWTEPGMMAPRPADPEWHGDPAIRTP